MRLYGRPFKQTGGPLGGGLISCLFWDCSGGGALDWVKMEVVGAVVASVGGGGYGPPLE